jgi:serine/threonine protein kinase
VTDGDIQANILINSEYRACLADFGLVAIAGTNSDEGSNSDPKTGGTIQWMAPELLDPKGYGYVKHARRKLPSKSTDIYALGMTILEVRIAAASLLLLRDANFPPQVITGQRPFEHAKKDDVVVRKVLTGARPDRPTVGFSNALWKLLTETWLEEFESSDSPSARPNITYILGQLQGEERSWSPTSGRPISPMQIERKLSGMVFLQYPVRYDLHYHHSGEFC